MDTSKSAAPKKARGPYKLTKATPLIVEALRNGNYFETAAAYAGISPSTFREWRRRGRKGEAPYAAFLEEVDKAQAVAEVDRVSVVIAAATDPKYWTAAAWWLERRFPGKWGRREQAHEPEAEARVDSESVEHELDRRLDELAKRRRARRAQE